MAWLALALERADRLVGIERAGALKTLAEQFLKSWVPEDGGGIPWRKQDQFFNAPANGPAGIFLARYGDRLRRAQQMADWIDETLIDPETHLVFDGVKGGSLVRAQYTYCQGVVLGLETELAVRTSDERHPARARRLIAAIDEHMAPGGVIKGAGGGDGGLFSGITARYLALAATALPGDSDEDAAARDTARKIVLASAQAAWDNRQTVDGLPLFGAFWDQTAEIPTGGGKEAQFIEGAVQLVGDAGARPVRAAVRMDVDGGRAHGVPVTRTRLGRDPTAKRFGENAAAALLLTFTVVAILWANSPWAQTYSEFWTTPVGLSFGDNHAELTVRELVNDGLMAFFFFIVGLEVKAQFTIGELTERSRAMVPVVAAIAGLTLPAVIFLLFNPSGDAARAWGVVISTDTAFLVGALAIIAPKYPARLRTFLLTLAVVDDVGALVAIAVFYSEKIRIVALLVAVVLLAGLLAVRRLPPAGRGVGVFGSGGGAVAGPVLRRRAPDAGRSRGGAGDPGVHPGTATGRGGDRRDPGLPAVAELRVRPRRDPQPARLDLDQRAAVDGVRPLCVVRGAAGLRAGERRCAP